MKGKILVLISLIVLVALFALRDVANADSVVCYDYDYQVLAHANSGNLETAVSGMMLLGYEPVGGVEVNGAVFYQAMLKTTLLSACDWDKNP